MKSAAIGSPKSVNQTPCRSPSDPHALRSMLFTQTPVSQLAVEGGAHLQAGAVYVSGKLDLHPVCHRQHFIGVDLHRKEGADAVRDPGHGCPGG